MRETTKESPFDRGQVQMSGRCQICGAEGDTLAVPGAPEPNMFCPRCAIEYGQGLSDDEARE